MTFVELMALDTKATSPVPSPVVPASLKATTPASNPALPQALMVDSMAATSHGSKPPRQQATMVSRSDATKASRGHDTTTSRHHEATTARQEALSESGLVSRLREAVKPLGKEGATHRFTSAEKASLAEIVYHYHRRGLRTSENEIVRTAIHWLLEDHAARGEQGILHRVLQALHQ
jgi:hypothetical protein